MTVKRMRTACILAVLFVFLFAAQAFETRACADDAELLELIPGQWTCTDETDREDGEPAEVTTVLTFEEDGTMSLRFESSDERLAFSCEGTWSFELVTGGMDRLNLVFTSTDSPRYAGSEYHLECVYYVYSESWVEDETLITYLLIEEYSHSGETPFEEAYGYDGVAVHREKGPNMRVANCKSYVSLREKRSQSAKRLAKVPLGASVLAFPEYGDENGFVYCVYQGREGFILSEYLEPVDGQAGQ